jgi:hypothetical protein
MSGLVAALSTVALAGAATAGMTDFDHLSEGITDYTFTDAGITFQNGYIGDDNQKRFAIDDGEGIFQFWGITDWVSGRVLGMGGHTNGPDGILFPSLSHIEMAPDTVQSYAAFTAFHVVADAYNDFTQNTLTLEALLDGQVVYSAEHHPGNVIYDDGKKEFGALRLEVSGVDFDLIRLTSDGPMNEGRTSILFDDVVMTPAPSSLALFGLGGLLARRRR